jgi:hypothetical protein
MANIAAKSIVPTTRRLFAAQEERLTAERFKKKNMACHLTSRDAVC